MRTADFDFDVPKDLIAQAPAPKRDASRMLVLHRASGQQEHRSFTDLTEYLRPGDVLVLNNSKVIPARLHGTNAKTGGRFELLLLEEMGLNDWWVMLKPGKRARNGTSIALSSPNGASCGVEATVIGENQEGHRRVRFLGIPNILEAIELLGEVPLPPYIARHGSATLEADRERYQTVYAGPPGSVAAPTAGLHFTEQMLRKVRARGTQVCFVTLHVGLGTFAPIKAEELSQHTMHEERYVVEKDTAHLINQARAQARRVVAVGTTTLRVLESIAQNMGGKIEAGAGRTRLFIHPPYDFHIVDVLLTNFHLPRSTLVMLASAFAAPGKTTGRETLLAAYAEAVRERYRFFSYGDSMLIV